jgi:IclR family pca regulon transcriptional regulator
MTVVATKAKAKKTAPADNPKNFVNSVGKAFAVLKSFTTDDFELTISEIAARADMDRGTAFRLVQTLVKLGYVQTVDQTRHYRLGLKCLD